MDRRHIVLVSQIPLWSMGKQTGGPAFRATLEGLGARHDVSLVTPALDYVEHADLPAGVTMHAFPHRLHGRLRSVPKAGWVVDTLAWYEFLSAAWKAAEGVCAARKPDLAYGYEIYGTPVARKVADAFRVPMVARYQGSLMSTRRHERAASLRYHKHLSALKTPADLYVMTDDGTLGDELLRDLGHPSDRVLFLMNGVDRSIRDAATHDARARLGANSPGDELLLTVSRLSHWKRVDRAVRVLAELVKRGRPARLAVVGVGPEEGRLRELAASLGLSERVTFAGGATRDELADYYRSADVLLSLYDYSNLANPVMEAILLGTPVVAYDAGGTEHLVKDGVNGLLVSDAEPSAIASVVEKLLADPGARCALGEAAAKWADEHLWTWEDRMAAELNAVEALMVMGSEQKPGV